MTKKKVLVFCDFYLPGFKSGGGMRTVVNLVDRFSGDYDFYVVTRNYDSVADQAPYRTVTTGAWNSVENAKVYYFGKGELTASVAARICSEVEPDIVYLNSAFSLPAIKFLSARQKRLVPDVPVILAPCGEMAKGALAIKPIKKRVFLEYAALTGLYRHVTWKASSEAESREIQKVFGKHVRIAVAPDLLPKTILPGYRQSAKPRKEKGRVRFVFMSRIARTKNLHFFLECLRQIDTGDISVDIIGPVEDRSYWRRCDAIISQLTPRVRVNTIGALAHQEAVQKLFESHFFTVPSLNENFGYVFIESLAAGTPLLISDRTFWNDVEDLGVGWNIPPNDAGQYIERIRECIDMDDVRYAGMSAAARAYALEWLADPHSESSMDAVFRMAVSARPGVTGNA